MLAWSQRTRGARAKPTLANSPGGFAMRSHRSAWALVIALLAAGLFPTGSRAVNGNIAPSAIEIDTPDTANLYPGGSSAACPVGSGTDWVKDCAPNTDAASLTNSVATGLIPGVTGKAGGTGHWHGARIVDGVAGSDQDIFLTGGKEDDVSTWNVGPGSVGSSKYDATQAYLANNQTDLFFGMERRGNNGTTAFDFEFNQAEPPGGIGTYIPTRTVNDALLTFELQGSGGSGSASAHYFRWNGSAYVAQALPSGTVASINDSTNTPAAPWGHVNDKGAWVGGNLARFEFGEAKVPLSVLPNVSVCGGSAYVQLRTRSSSTSTSDLKDASKIFDFQFGSPSAVQALGTNCNQQFTYDGTGSVGSTGSTAGLTYNWDITVSPTNATLSGGGVSAAGTAGKYTSSSASGTVDVTLPSGVDSATVSVKNTISDNGCTNSTGSKTVTVYRRLGAVATLTPQCDNRFSYSATASGGLAPYSYAWTFQRNSAADGSGTWSDVGTSATASGTFVAGQAGAYRGLLTVTDSAATAVSGVTVKPQCTKSVPSNTVNVYNAVGGTIALTGDCDDTFTYAAAGSGGKAPYTYAVTVEKQVSGTWTTAHTFTASDTLASPGISGSLDVDNFATGAKGDGRYRARVRITDSQGIVCTGNATSNEIDVVHGLTASASKTGVDGNTLTAQLTGVTSGTSVQWQRQVGGSWVDVNGATATTLGYSSFEADTSPVATTFTIAAPNPASGSYAGKLYAVTLRLKATRVINGATCEAFSSGVVVKKVVAVDP